MVSCWFAACCYLIGSIYGFVLCALVVCNKNSEEDNE